MFSILNPDFNAVYHNAIMSMPRLCTGSKTFEFLRTVVGKLNVINKVFFNERKRLIVQNSSVRLPENITVAFRLKAGSNFSLSLDQKHKVL